MWGNLAASTLVVLALVAVASCRCKPGEPARTAAPRLSRDDLVANVTRMILEAHSRRDRARLDRADRLLADALQVKPRDEDRLWAARGHVQIAAATFAYNATAAGRRQVPASAVGMFREALRINPRNARALHGMAKYHEFRGEHRAALAQDDKVLAFAPHDIQALKHRGRCLLNLGQYARAEQAFLVALKQAEARGDRDAMIFVLELLGKAYLKQRKYRQAEEVLLRAVKGAEVSRVAACPYAALGELYTATGRDEEAVKTSMRAADMEKSVPQMQYLAALTCYEEGYYPEAQRYISRALKLERNQASFSKLRDKIRAVVKPGSAAVELSAALEGLHEQQHRRARIHVDRALAAGAGARARVIKGFLMLLEKKYAKAEKLFLAAGKAAPSDAGARVGLGHLGIVRKDYARARRLLEPAVKEGEKRYRDAKVVDRARGEYGWLTYRMACQGMGWLLSNQNRHRAALVQFDRVLTGDPEDVFALLGKGNSLNALGQLDGAQMHLQRVLELDPYNQYALAELALVHFNRGKMGRAEELFKAALRQSGKARYTCPHEGLGMVYLRAGKLGPARASFRKAIEINPNIEYKKFNGLARILIREGKYAGARKLLRKSMQNYPYDDEAKKLLAGIKGR